MNKKLYAGFDLGGTNLKYGLMDEQSQLVFRKMAPTPPTIDDLLRLIEEAMKELEKESDGCLKAVGFGFPGIYSQEQKKILQSPNYANLDGFELQPALSRIVGVPFTVDNDANMAAYGEWACGAGKGIQSLVFLTIGTGVGSGIILGGDVWRGKCGFAGELGHITVNLDGDKCNCGSQGCLETEVSGRKIVKNYLDLSKTKKHQKKLSAEEVYELAVSGDTAARKSFAIAGTYLGIGLGTVINILNPEKILLGGGVMMTGDFLLPAAVEESRRRSYNDAFACCSIEKAILGNDAGVLGAASWAKGKS